MMSAMTAACSVGLASPPAAPSRSIRHQAAPASLVGRRGVRTRSARQITTRASSGDNNSNGDFNSNASVARRALLTAAGIGLTVPVIKIIANDLGYEIEEEDSEFAPLPDPGTQYALATFAGGCFWCMEAPFDRIPGVIATTSGYTGGFKQKPTYLQVSAGTTGHAESVQVMYDPKICSFDTLLDVYWHQVDPTTPDRQFVDKGPQYRTAIFYHNEEQKKKAEESKARLEAEGIFGKNRKIVTQIVPAGKFWPAEKYHQDYYERNAARYSVYRALSGRDNYIESVWGPQEAIHG